MGTSGAGAPSVVAISDSGAMDVWDRLTSDPAAALVDRRTRAGWSCVDDPSSAPIGQWPLIAAYPSFPDSRVDPSFTDGREESANTPTRLSRETACNFKILERASDSVGTDSALAAGLESFGAGKTTEIFFNCRSGGRSQATVVTKAATGNAPCRSLADGLEGPLDPNRYRGNAGDWKAAGLLWAQG